MSHPGLSPLSLTIGVNPLPSHGHNMLLTAGVIPLLDPRLGHTVKPGLGIMQTAIAVNPLSGLGLGLL